MAANKLYSIGEVSKLCNISTKALRFYDKIGVIAPLSGDLSALGLGIKNSVDLAIRQANESNAVPGWKLELAAEDDQATPDVGKNAATKLSSDDEVVDAEVVEDEVDEDDK